MKPKLKSSVWLKSCDNCTAQEGRHYCLLHTVQIKNMDTVACADWKDKHSPKTREEIARDDEEDRKAEELHAMHHETHPLSFFG